MHKSNEQSKYFHSAQNYKDLRIRHWNNIVNRKQLGKGHAFYHNRLKEIFSSQVPADQTILEIGCGKGDLLAHLKPSIGIGVDFSSTMIQSAKDRHPHLQFFIADAHDLQMDKKFDIIIVSDLLNELWDVELFFKNLKKLTLPHTRIIINLYSRVWEFPLRLVRKLGLATPLLKQNWLTVADIKGLEHLAGYETVRSWSEILIPFRIPLLSHLANKILVKIWPFNFFALTNFIVIKTCETDVKEEIAPLVSIVVAARNESGHIQDIFFRTEDPGFKNELIFVEGGSSDGTYDEIEKHIQKNPHRKCKLFKQNGIGKGDAVRLGFDNADGDILMILDADLTVPPEDLKRFHSAIISGKGEFINGVRLVYPMEDEAMRYFNILGNKFFSLAFTWLLDQPIKDTLCGTKVLWKSDYQKIKKNRKYFGDFDPFGDFDLLFGAAKINLKIVEIPIRYRSRHYGETNIDRWRHGLLLLKMTLFAIRKIKFV